MTTKTEWFASMTVSTTTSASMMYGFVHGFVVVMGVVEFRYYNFNLFFFMPAITLRLRFGQCDLVTYPPPPPALTDMAEIREITVMNNCLTNSIYRTCSLL